MGAVGAGIKPGTLVQIDPQALRTSLRIRSVHDIDLPTVLRLGRCLGLKMPEEILIYGIQAEDAQTIGESMTGSVTRGMREAVDLVLHLLTSDGRH